MKRKREQENEKETEKEHRQIIKGSTQWLTGNYKARERQGDAMQK